MSLKTDLKKHPKEYLRRGLADKLNFGTPFRVGGVSYRRMSAGRVAVRQVVSVDKAIDIILKQLEEH
jgi:hypothetical protein